jgi:putative methionine-R-sulfoxide reductase with GAF domain
MKRPYREIAEKLAFAGDRHQRMGALVDALWEALAPTGVSWVGFYLYEGQDELVLGPSRDKPACSPIGLHGACGRAFTEKRPLVVRDVRRLGENYVACDPRDRSELVIPLLDPDGTCWGVLDLDSHDVDAFDASDVVGLGALLRVTGLHSATLPVGDPIVV